jgi:hypothetical protein
MSRVIHKVQLTYNQVVKHTVTVSEGAFRVLTVHELDGIPTIWYETLEVTMIPKEITFTIVGTGDEVPDHSEYLGTAFCKGVWHIYQTPPTSKL